MFDSWVKVLLMEEKERYPSLTSIRFVFLDSSMAFRNPLNRRMRTRIFLWCGRGERAKALPMPN
jgi:hypothetical protein